MSNQTDRLNTALDGRYRIIRHLGEGGMATVYLCEDLKHDRKVALKVLKPELAAVLGAERFVLEIKTTASMSHPHILPLFDSGTADGFLFYVMPFIEGETLRDKLNRETQLGIDEAVRIAREVLDALEYAHSHGVIHRDIKPENILLHGGHAMVADFGIALAVSAAAGGRMTETGLSLGTPHYMSPEQATAEKEISGRSDVYSLASVLYEMLTGNPPHTGASAQQIIMKIIAEPADAVTKYRKSVPSNVAAATAQALEKLPADRFASAREFGEALVNASFTVASVGRGGVAKAASAIGRPRTTSYAVGAVGAVLALVAAWGWLRPAAEPTLHVSIPPAAGTSFVPDLGPPTLSPDGRTVVFTALRDGQTRLYRRPVDGFTVEAITGTEDAMSPFFSPDGLTVGFYTRARQLRKVALAGGAATTLAEIPFYRSGAIWRRDGTILVVSDARGLYTVPDHGGVLTPFAETDTVIGVHRIDHPQELSDGRLLATLTARLSIGRLVTMDPGARAWRLISTSASGVFIQGGFLVARPRTEQLASRFDLSTGQTAGAPLAVLEGADVKVSVNARDDVAYFAFPNAPRHVLTLVNRSGIGTPVATAAGDFRHPRLSPDGTRLGLMVRSDLWVLDLRTSAMVRLTTGDNITEPQWSPDGRRIAHTVHDSTTGRDPPAIRNADGTGNARVVGTTEGDAWTSDWSPNGRHLAVYGGKVGMNVFVVDLDSAQAVHPVTRMTAIARNARFSPDGRWLAYQSNETGRMQIYVVSYPSLDQRRPISTEGGTEPAWRPLGGELYFRNGASMMAVTVRTGATLDVGTPRELFRGDFLEDETGDRSYDVMPDGQHFIMLRANPAAAPDLRVIRNWSRELKATVPR